MRRGCSRGDGDDGGGGDDGGDGYGDDPLICTICIGEIRDIMIAWWQGDMLNIHRIFFHLFCH